MGAKKTESRGAGSQSEKRVASTRRTAVMDVGKAALAGVGRTLGIGRGSGDTVEIVGGAQGTGVGREATAVIEGMESGQEDIERRRMQGVN